MDIATETFSWVYSRHVIDLGRRQNAPHPAHRIADSVFGVGMTLLAYDVVFPKNSSLNQASLAIGPPIYGLALSFAVAALYLLSQQRRRVMRGTEPSRYVNLEFGLLFAVVLLPISRRAFVFDNQMGGRQASAIFYSANLAAPATINAALWILSPVPAPDLPRTTACDKLASALVALFFLTSFGVMFISPKVSERLWWGAFAAPFLIRLARAKLASQGKVE